VTRASGREGSSAAAAGAAVATPAPTRRRNRPLSTPAVTVDGVLLAAEVRLTAAVWVMLMELPLYCVVVT
jgi:hypothetical protein